MVTNPGKYSTLGNGSTLSAILDDTDHPHTGLIKSLSVGLGGNYAISGFNITKTNATQFSVASGVIFRDGAKVAISASSSPHGTALTATTDFYHLLTVNSSGAFVLTAPSAASKIPEMPSDSVPIAVIAYKGSASDGSDMYIQYLTITKTDNSLSIGYDNSGYTEMSKITAASGGTTVEVPTAGGDFVIDNTDADKKIVARLGSDDANTAFEVRNNSDSAKLSITGAGATTVTGDLSVTGQITGTSTGTTDAGLTLINTDSGTGTAPDLVFFRNSSSPADNDFTMRIDARGKNDAGSPENIDYTSIFARILDKTDGTEDGTLLIGSIVDGDTVDAFNTQLMVEGSGIRVRGLTGTGTAPAGEISIETRETTIVANDELGRINFSAPVEGSGSDATEVSASIKAIAQDTFSSSVNATDLILSTGSSGAATEKLRVTSDGKIGINTNNPDNALQVVNSDSTTNAVVFPLKITEETSGTPATGLGVGIQFEVETSAGNNEIGATIETAITDTTGGSEDFSLILKTMSGGAAAAERLKFDNSGSMITPMTDGRAHTYMTPGGGMLVSGPTGTKGQLMHGYIQIPDVRNSANNFFELPATSSSTVNTGQIIIIKNVTSASAIISPASGDEIDFAQTTHAMIGTSNVLTLPSMGCVTLCAYISYDKNNLTDANGLGNLQNGWFIVSST
mgnify:FL=1